MRWKDLTTTPIKQVSVRQVYKQACIKEKAEGLIRCLLPASLEAPFRLVRRGAECLLYTGARYSGGIYPITDDDVKAAMLGVGKSRNLKDNKKAKANPKPK